MYGVVHCMPDASKNFDTTVAIESTTVALCCSGLNFVLPVTSSIGFLIFYILFIRVLPSSYQTETDSCLGEFWESLQAGSEANLKGLKQRLESVQWTNGYKSC